MTNVLGFINKNGTRVVLEGKRIGRTGDFRVLRGSPKREARVLTGRKGPEALKDGGGVGMARSMGRVLDGGLCRIGLMKPSGAPLLMKREMKIEEAKPLPKAVEEVKPVEEPKVEVAVETSEAVKPKAEVAEAVLTITEVGEEDGEVVAPAVALPELPEPKVEAEAEVVPVEQPRDRKGKKKWKSGRQEVKASSEDEKVEAE